MGRELDAIAVRAEQVLHEAGQSSLPIDVLAIAKDRDIAIVPKETAGGVSGMLIRVGDDFTIAYATHFANDGFERFSIGHELGHYFLDGHIGHVLGPDGFHESRAGYVSRDRYEREADRFSAALLMPYTPFRQAARRVGDGLAGIESLAEVCRTSLSATAIRYAECVADEVYAVVVTMGDTIEFCTTSDRLKKLPGVTWRKKGDPIPRRSATCRLIGDPGRVLDCDRDDGTAHLHDWFDGGPDLQLTEEALGLGRSGRTLTILTALDAPDDDEAEEDAALVESWTPTLGRSRRQR